MNMGGAIEGLTGASATQRKNTPQEHPQTFDS